MKSKIDARVSVKPKYEQFQIIEKLLTTLCCSNQLQQIKSQCTNASSKSAIGTF